MTIAEKLTKIAENIQNVFNAGYKKGIAENPGSGDIETVEQATPSITISSAGLITASATQEEGYVLEGTKSATKQLTVQPAKTITPTTGNQIAVSASRYTTGVVIVKGDANLIADNIKSGIHIFGVTGTYEGSGGGSSVDEESINTALDDVIVFQKSFLPPLPTFTFNEYGTLHTLEFEEGMTWREWCASVYNTVELYINEEQSNAVYHGVYSVMSATNGFQIYDYNYIYANETYAKA